MKDYTGLKAGRLTLVKPSDKRTKQRQVLWEAKCDCGADLLVRPTQVLNGNTSSCGCLQKELKRTQQHTRRHEPIISSARHVWHGTYTDGCDFDTFYRLSQLPCHYCGRTPYRVFNVGVNKRLHDVPVSDIQIQEGNFTYNGLDRIDSSRGLHRIM